MDSDGRHYLYERCSCDDNTCVAWLEVTMPEKVGEYRIRILENKDDGAFRDMYVDSEGISRIINGLKYLLKVEDYHIQGAK